jgi:nitroreductase
METWDALRARRNVRQYTDQPIPDEALDQILEAARRTPSGGNRQWWDFIVVTGRNELEELAKTWPQGGTHISRAQAAIVLVAPVVKEDEAPLVHYDLGQATMAIMLAATDLGIGTGHAVVREKALARELLGLPEDRDAAYMIGLGYPEKPFRPLKKPDRRPFDDVVHRQRF